MALIIADRVKETCTSPGTGTVSLLGAVTGFQSFSTAIGNGNTTYYTIADQSGANWEVGLGTYTSSGSTLARNTVLDSSNSGSLVNFSSGTQDVFVTYPADKAIYVGSNGDFVNVTASGTVSDGAGNVRTIPLSAQGSAYILTAGDAGELISISTGGVTLNTSTFTAGQAVTIYNNSSSSQTITQGPSVTMYLAGTATTGSRTLAQRGVCTILCVTNSTTFVISGAGLT